MEKKIVGYEGMSCENNKFIPVEDAFQYALERVSRNEQDKNEFIEWFFSGNWVEVREGTRWD